jgi:hypothetical protein
VAKGWRIEKDSIKRIVVAILELFTIDVLENYRARIAIGALYYC